MRKSAIGDFYETTVNSDDGKQKRSNNIFITSDGRCFLAGNVFALTIGSNNEIIHCIRQATKTPDSVKLRLGPFKRSPYSGFLKADITAVEGARTQTSAIFVTEDRRAGVLGIVLPFAESYVQELIETDDQPSAGPRNAPVTIVEYSDLQCPSCAQFHHYLEDVLLPKYRDRIRLIFKELHISTHNWSLTAAVANECVYQTAPANFLAFRSSVFSHQSVISPGNVREKMLEFGAELGIDRHRLGECIDTKASLARVKAGRNEAEALQVTKTPTTFVNGRIVIGAPSPHSFAEIVEEAPQARPRR